MSYPDPDQQPQGHQGLPGQGDPPPGQFTEGSGEGEAAYPHHPQSSPGFEQSGVPAVPVHPQQGVPPPQQYAPPPPPEPPAYNTPFSQSEMAMPRASASGGKAVLWAAVGGVGVILVLVIGFFVYRSIQDPFRTLDTFPTEKYLENYESVVGSRFRAKLTVAAELGGTFDSGRLLSFRDESSQRSLAVLVSPALGQIGFSKGQSYLAEIEVKEGGLIYAHAFRKN